MPTDDITPMLRQLEESAGIQCVLDMIPVCSCPGTGVEGFPDLEYVIEGSKYYVTRDNYMIREDDTCYLKIMHHPTIPYHIMGLTFFQNYYTVFDGEQKRIGFAPSIHADTRLYELIEGAQQLFTLPKTSTEDSSL